MSSATVAASFHLGPVHLYFLFQDSYSKARVIAKIEDINDNPPSPKDENSLTLILCENSDVNTLVRHNTTCVTTVFSKMLFPF